MSSHTSFRGGECKDIRQRLFVAVEEGNVELVDRPFATTSLQVSDATQALGHALPRPAVMHFLLMHSADPKAFDDIEDIRSDGNLKLLVEFGYEIRPSAHDTLSWRLRYATCLRRIAGWLKLWTHALPAVCVAHAFSPIVESLTGTGCYVHPRFPARNYQSATW